MDSHVECFPGNLGDYNGEQGERFNRNIKVMEQRYQASKQAFKLRLHKLFID